MLRFLAKKTIFYSTNPSFVVVPNEVRNSCSAVTKHRNQFQKPSSPKPLEEIKINMVALDGGGTCIDQYCTAPLISFIEAFDKTYGISIDFSLAQEPMGRDKLEHIREILTKLKDMPLWKQKQGNRIPNENDVMSVYKNYLAIEPANVEKYSVPVDGIVAAVEALRAQNILVCLHTAYRGQAVQAMLKTAKKHGLVFKDNEVVTADHLIDKKTSQLTDQLRPYGGLIRYLAKQHHIDDPAKIVVCDDSIPGIHAGVDAAAWVVGVPGTGMRLTEPLAARQGFFDIQARRDMAMKELSQNGAHFVLNHLHKLPEVVRYINQALYEGETPTSGYDELDKKEKLSYVSGC